jgi:hypothetical protein
MQVLCNTSPINVHPHGSQTMASFMVGLSIHHSDDPVFVPMLLAVKEKEAFKDKERVLRYFVDVQITDRQNVDSKIVDTKMSTSKLRTQKL